MVNRIHMLQPVWLSYVTRTNLFIRLVLEISLRSHSLNDFNQNLNVSKAPRAQLTWVDLCKWKINRLAILLIFLTMKATCQISWMFLCEHDVFQPGVQQITPVINLLIEARLVFILGIFDIFYLFKILCCQRSCPTWTKCSDGMFYIVIGTRCIYIHIYIERLTEIQFCARLSHSSKRSVQMPREFHRCRN